MCRNDNLCGAAGYGDASAYSAMWAATPVWMRVLVVISRLFGVRFFLCYGNLDVLRDDHSAGRATCDDLREGGGGLI